jgi:hypothetical protein
MNLNLSLTLRNEIKSSRSGLTLIAPCAVEGDYFLGSLAKNFAEDGKKYLFDTVIMLTTCSRMLPLYRE